MTKIQSEQLILIAEDSDDDYEITVHALKKCGNLRNPIHRCEDGQELLDYLLHRGIYEDSPTRMLPGIILLDLNMPGIGGRTALREIKSNDELKDIPIIILTTSDDASDINDCYKEGANTFIQKPVDLEGFFKAIQSLKEYWFEIAILPKQL